MRKKIQINFGFVSFFFTYEIFDLRFKVGFKFNVWLWTLIQVGSQSE